MHKAFSTAIASVLLATSAIGSGAAADSRHSRFDQQDRVVQDYCGRHNDNDCRDWSRNRDNWDEARYQGWYRNHYRNHDFGADEAFAGLFGFAAGVIASSAANGGSTHAVACENRFRSYDRGTDTYLGLDGVRHGCML